MKKVTNSLALIALTAIVFFTACKKEEAVTTNPQNTTTDEVDAIIRRLSDSVQLGGVEFSSKEDYEKLPKADVSQFKPLIENAVQLRASSFQLPLPPVGNQGREGSCTAFSMAYAGISYYLNVVNHLPYTTTGALRSPEFLYNTTKSYGDCSSGAYPQNVLYSLVNKGVCSWSEMPYTDNGCTQQPTTTQKQQALQGRIRNYYSVYAAQVKQYIQAGFPVIMGFQLEDNFYSQTASSPFIWKTKGGRIYGGHAVIIMGYDDNARVYKIQNSWGTSVQDRGYFYISYDLLPYIAQEMYVMQPM